MEAVERDWRAEEDARYLARAMEVLNDKDRHERATAAAKRLVEEREESADAMKRVAGMGAGRKHTMSNLNKQLRQEVNSYGVNRR